MANGETSDFGTRLRTTRVGASLSQTDLAERAGLTPAAISQIEAGERLPAFNTLSRLAAALKTSVGYLLGEQVAEVPPEMKAMFRDLDDLSPADREKVKGFAAFLNAQAKADPTK
jgi:transcriptional regulator with XRE-family HTH domain